MIRKLTLAVGFGAGYVLGAKAGKERYAQIESKARELLGQPAVQNFTDTVATTATGAAEKAKATVNEKVEAVGDKVGSSGSSSAGSTGSTAPLTDEVVLVDLGSTTPIVGASASGTAPDVL